MPSPFPGMDPYIETRGWEDFHLTMITGLREELVPQVRPRYVVRVEERVYVETMTLPQPERVREAFLTIRALESLTEPVHQPLRPRRVRLQPRLSAAASTAAQPRRPVVG